MLNAVFGPITRRRLLGTAALSAAAVSFAGCSSGGSDSPPGAEGDRPAGPTTFPKTFPAVPARVPESSYAYDDMTTNVTMSLMASGPFSQPRPDDPIQKYLQEKFNATISYTSLSGDDMRNKLALAFTSGDGAPDFVLIPYDQRDVAAALHEQGQLLAADDLLGLMPQAASYLTEDFKKWATADDEMMGIPIYSVFGEFNNTYARTDFLKSIGMEKPATTDELMRYAKALRDNDPTPDKEGPWFMATGGGGTGWGMIDFLRSYFGHPSFNVVDGKINHPMIDGTTKAYLQFVSELYAEKLLPPDWYTTAWEPLKSRTFNDQLGMITYPGWNLASETFAARKKFSAVEAWEPMGVVSGPVGTGKLPPGNYPGGLYVFNAKLKDDEAKLRRIAHMIDTFVYPNVNYFEVAQGGGPAIWPGKVTAEFDASTGLNVFTVPADAPSMSDTKYQGLGDWQAFGYTLRWQTYTDKVGNYGFAWNETTQALPRWDNFDIQLNLDPKPVQDVLTLGQKSEIQFVLGKRSFDEWDAYVEDWKKGGGQELLEQAAEQLGATT